MPVGHYHTNSPLSSNCVVSPKKKTYFKFILVVVLVAMCNNFCNRFQVSTVCFLMEEGLRFKSIQNLRKSELCFAKIGDGNV